MDAGTIAFCVSGAYIVIGWVVCAISGFIFNKYKDRDLAILAGILWPLFILVVIGAYIVEVCSGLVSLIPKRVAKCVLTVLRIVFTPWNIGRMYREWREGK